MADSKISNLTEAIVPLVGTEVLPIVQSGVTKQVSVDSLTNGRSVNLGTSSVIGGATGNKVLSLGNAPSTNASCYLNLFGTNSQKNWRIATNQTLAGAFEIQYSTAGGGTTFTTSPFAVTNAGDIRFAVGNLIQGTASKGVDFSANTPAAGKTSQLLNWYEEGTWTPSLVPGTSGSVTLTTASAKYTRVGRQVVVTGICEVQSVSSPVGALLLQGLPFTNASDNGSRSSAAIYATGLAVTATTQIMGRIVPSESQIRIDKFISGSTSAMAGDLQAGSVIQFSLTYFV